MNPILSKGGMSFIGTLYLVSHIVLNLLADYIIVTVFLFW